MSSATSTDDNTRLNCGVRHLTGSRGAAAFCANANRDKLRRHIEAVTPVSDEEFAQIGTFFLSKHIRRRQYLLHEGDEAKHEYLVLSGLFRVFYLDDDGKEYIVRFADENCWMSDYKAYFNRDPATMFIECLEAGGVQCITHAAREELTAGLAVMDRFFKAQLTNSYVDQEERIKLLLSNTPRQRYEEFSRLHPTLIQRVPKKDIAKYLGVCRETLSRLYPNC